LKFGRWDFLATEDTEGTENFDFGFQISKEISKGSPDYPQN
jgi:hypothetical protein